MPSVASASRSTNARSQFLNRQTIGLSLAAVWFIIPFLFEFGDLSTEGRRMLSIFGAAVVLWITEAIPLFATAVAIIFAEILMVSDQSLLDLSHGYDAPPFAGFYAALAHPVLMLFLGGFFLAHGAAKFGLDRNLAGVLLRPFGTAPRSLLAGLMIITAVLSMFMSNTATTAAMIAVVLPVIATLPPGDPLAAGMALSVPLAANIGGMGTPVGTPPNAIALGRLSDEGISIDFLSWMAMALPLVIVMLLVAWAVLMWRYPPATRSVELEIGGSFDQRRQAVIFYAIFAATVFLWLSEPLHGVPSTIVGFVPVVALLASGVFDANDLKQLNWHVLWLVGGGIALGTGVAVSGLDEWLVGLIDWSSLSSYVLLGGLGIFALVLSTVISNSATANLLIPIGVTLALSPAVDVEPILVGVLIALACSLAMALPVSTPPNAVAYATGVVQSKDLLLSGIIVGVTGLALVVVVAPPLWSFMGLVP